MLIHKIQLDILLNQASYYNFKSKNWKCKRKS